MWSRVGEGRERKSGREKRTEEEIRQGTRRIVRSESSGEKMKCNEMRRQGTRRRMGAERR